MVSKKLLLSVAALVLALALPQTAQAQNRLRLPADLSPGDVGRLAGNSNYEERDGIPRKIEVQVQNVRPETTQLDGWIYYADTGDIVYFTTFGVVNGIGRVELETEFGHFVPQVRAGDLILSTR